MENSKISVRNLNLHYGDNHALKNVNMDKLMDDFKEYKNLLPIVNKYEHKE